MGNENFGTSVRLEFAERGRKFHITNQGLVRPCSANKRRCPYGQHFDTVEDGESKRQRVSGIRNTHDEVFHFSENFDSNIVEENSEKAKLKKAGEIFGINASLRSMSERAKEIYYRTGKRPDGAVGDITIPLPNKEKIVLKREVYDNREGTAVIPRWQIRYYTNEMVVGGKTKVFTTIVELKHKQAHDELQFFLQEYYANVINLKEDLNPAQEDAIQRETTKLYKQSLQKITEIETMCQGADTLHRRFGIDLFEKNDRSELCIESTPSRSSIQPHDIVDSLKVHASIDKKVHPVSIKFSESIRTKKLSLDWNMERSVAGDWLCTYQQGDKNLETYVITEDNIDEVAGRMKDILEKSGVYRDYATYESLFIKQVFTDVEPAIKNYENAVKARLSAPQPVGDEQPEKPMKKSANKQKETKKKLFGLF